MGHIFSLSICLFGISRHHQAIAISLSFKKSLSVQTGSKGCSATAFGTQTGENKPFSIYTRGAWATGHLVAPRSTSPPPIRRAEEAAGGIKPPEGSPGLLRSRLTPSYLGDRSKRNGRAGLKGTNAMRREVQWAVTILNTAIVSHTQAELKSFQILNGRRNHALTCRRSYNQGR